METVVCLSGECLEMVWVYDGVVFFNFVSQPSPHLPDSFYIQYSWIWQVSSLCHSPLDIKYFACWSNTKDLQWLFCKQYSQQQIWVSPKLGVPPQTNSLNCWVLVWNHTEPVEFPFSSCHCAAGLLLSQLPAGAARANQAWVLILVSKWPWALEKVTGPFKNSNFLVYVRFLECKWLWQRVEQLPGIRALAALAYKTWRIYDIWGILKGPCRKANT